ncbi:MAG: hypothetical protein ACK5OA_10765 [Acidovorax sp.]
MSKPIPAGQVPAWCAAQLEPMRRAVQALLQHTPGDAAQDPSGQPAPAVAGCKVALQGNLSA